jgi:hypothetical protein
MQRSHARNGKDDLLHEVVAHVERHVGAISNVVHPLGDSLVHVDVLHVRPSAKRRCHTLVTCGMSRRPMCPPEAAKDCRHAELYMSLPADWPVPSDEEARRWRPCSHCLKTHPSSADIAELAWFWPFLELAELARLPHVSESWLWEGHTVGAPDPKERIAPGVSFTAWILGPHLSLGHEACVFRAGGRNIVCHSVIPIYPEELDVAMHRGSEELFRRLAKAGVSDVLDVSRANVGAG